MATLEIDDSAESIAVLRRILPPHVQADDCEASPQGYRWVQLLLRDTPSGQFPAEDTSDVLAALELSSSIFGSFRIVHGDHWMRRAVANGATL